jgi:Lrp/AsnC family transcriptional regulator, leucine-responsive regulatory protein
MPKIKLDRIDLKIISLLQKDGRMTSQQLAEQVGLSPSPCARRVRILEESGIIKGVRVREAHAPT